MNNIIPIISAVSITVVVLGLIFVDCSTDSVPPVTQQGKF